MKRVLVLGAGMVAGAHVRYLLRQPELHVTVASRTLRKAEEIVLDHPRGSAVQLRSADAVSVDSDDAAAMEALIRQSDLAVSLLPWIYHPAVARLCVKHRVHMVTTSYVKEPMAQLDGAAREAGVILLNEIGVDPGIDHMTAMRVIHRVQQEGGAITGFTSWCGGLPAPEANTNPLGYKFSWSPRGVLLAGKNSAHFLRDGQKVTIPAGRLFEHHWPVPVEIEGEQVEFEGYPNRDSLPYMYTYGIASAHLRTMFRGTLRNPGWCATIGAIANIGWLGEEPLEGIESWSFGQLTSRLAGTQGKLPADLAARLEVATDSPVMRNLAWLGLLGDDPLPVGARAPIDILTARMLERMSYAPGERDMLVLQHEFLAAYSDRSEKIVSTMVDFGIPGGDSSMSRTVGLPAAIGARLILEGTIQLTGVQVPVVPEIYQPVLEELQALGIRFEERWEAV